MALELVFMLLTGVVVVASAQPAGVQPISFQTTERLDVLGDALPPGAVARLGTTRFRPGGLVFRLAYSRNGKRLIAVAGTDVIIFEAATGREIRRVRDYAGKRSSSTAQVISPDRLTLAFATTQWIELLDLATRRVRLSWKAPGAESISYSPDGKLLATTDSDGIITLWDPATGKRIRQLSSLQESHHPIAFSPDGRTFAYSYGSPRASASLRLCATESGKDILTFAVRGGTERLRGDLGSPRFSSDGRVLAAIEIALERTGVRSRVHLWDIVTAKELDFLTPDAVESSEAAFAPGAPMIALSGNNGTIYVWDVAAKREVRRLRMDAAPLFSIAFSPDGKRLAVLGMDFVLHQWNLSTGQESPVYAAHWRRISAAAFSPDRDIVATASADKTILLWEARSGRLLRRIEPADLRAAELARTKYYQSRIRAPGADGFTAAFFDYIDFVRAPLEDSSFALMLAFSPDGRVLIATCTDGTIRFWDVKTGRELQRIAPREHYLSSALAVSSDGGTLAVCERGSRGIYRGLAPRIVFYDVKNRRERCLASPSSSLSRVMFAARDQILLAAAFDPPAVHARIYSLDAKSGEETSHFDARAATAEIAWSPHASVIALQDRVDRENELFAIRFYDRSTGQFLRRTGSYYRPLRGFVQSPDGRTVSGVTADDGRLHCWEVATATERRVLAGEQYSQALCYSPDSARVVSTGAAATALVWQVIELSDRPGRALAQDEVNALWADLAGENAVRAEHALAILVASPQQSLPLLRAHLRPVPPITRASVERWITDLSSADPAVNQSALAKLERAGEAAESALRLAIRRTASAAARARIALLLEELDPIAFVAPAEHLRTGRCLEILERLGRHREARDLLANLASGAPEAGQTTDAQAVLRRLALRRDESQSQ